MAVIAIRKERLILASSLLSSVPLIGGCFGIAGLLYKWIESPELGGEAAVRIAIVLAGQVAVVWYMRRRVMRRIERQKWRLQIARRS